MEEIESLIKSLREDVIHYGGVLNKSGTWLFLAVLACWSLPDGLPRVVAAAAVFVIFSHQVVSQLRSKTPFRKRVKQLMEDIDNNIGCPTQRDALKYRLLEVKKTYLGNWRIVSKTPAYFASGVLFYISLMSWAGKF